MKLIHVAAAVLNQTPLDWESNTANILAAMRSAPEHAAQAEKEYRTNPDLTDFNAFGEDDLHVESGSTEAG